MFFISHSETEITTAQRDFTQRSKGARAQRISHSDTAIATPQRDFTRRNSDNNERKGISRKEAKGQGRKGFHTAKQR